MTEAEFRQIFNRTLRGTDTGLLYIDHAAGGEARIVVGLNGDRVVTHGGHEIPLEQLCDHPVIEDWLLDRSPEPGPPAPAFK